MDNVTLFGIVVMGFFCSMAAYYGYRATRMRMLQRKLKREEQESKK